MVAAIPSFTSQADFKSAYSTLNNTYKTGKTKDVRWRKWQLKQLYWLLDENEDAFADALNKDLHRSRPEAIFYDIVSVKNDVLDAIKHIDEWAQPQTVSDAGFIMGRLGKAHLRKEPLGVALVIGAWNFPLFTLLGPTIPAIAAGNCVILKPSELAPTASELFASLVPKYMDSTAVSVVTGGPKETGFVLEHKFNHIFYTGGSKVGRIIATAAAKHLIPVVLELGGQAPAIVTKTANIDIAAKRIANAKISNAGQICLNVNHIFAEPEIHDQLVERMTYYLKLWLSDPDTKASTEMKVGAGTGQIAHIISDNHYVRVSNLLKNTKGDVVYTGAHDAVTKFAHPSIITNVTTSDSLLSEELFAPFIPVIRSSIPDAISSITSMPHPLGLYVFSNSQPEIDSILGATTSGGVTINDVMVHAGVSGFPFGGVGESGYGSYKGKYGFDAFSHTRPVVTVPTWMDGLMSFRYPPLVESNRKYLERAKPNFRKGERLEDQDGSRGLLRWLW